SPCRRPRGARSRRPARRARARRTPPQPRRGSGGGCPRHRVAMDCRRGSKRKTSKRRARSAYGRVPAGMGQAQVIERPAAPHGLVLGGLALGGAAYALLQSLVVPALTVLQEDLNASASGVAWIFTAYLLAASVITPIAGRLGHSI